jgi:hypothetical protein
MKKIFFLLLIAIACKTTTAQNVGIGTTVPNVDALLDISSTSKGVLFPRMTTVQRISIPTPPNGLMVFDTDRNELYQYISSTFSWKALISDSYWRRQSLTRNRIGNSNDSVGIGILSPTEWLDVDGNIRSRNDLLADGRLIATGTVTGSGLITPGGLTVSANGLVGGNFTANGDLSTNSDLIINNAGATLQLKNGSNVSKGFFQLSGDNVRFGTNSGNTTGDLVIRMNGTDRMVVRENGNVGIGNSGSPSYKLAVTGGDTFLGGDINVSGKVIRTTVSGSNSLLPIMYGRVRGDGTIISGTENFTIVKSTVAPGNYQIHSPLISGNCVAFVTCLDDNFIGRANSIANICVTSTRHILAGQMDIEFQFIIYCSNQ